METNVMPDSYRVETVMELTGLSWEQIYDLLNEGLFPFPADHPPLSPKIWSSYAIHDWIAEQLINSL